MVTVVDIGKGSKDDEPIENMPIIPIEMLDGTGWVLTITIGEVHPIKEDLNTCLVVTDTSPEGFTVKHSVREMVCRWVVGLEALKEVADGEG